MAKHKFASISLTVCDRAISSKFSTHRVSKECTLCNFPKIFLSPKMAKHNFIALIHPIQWTIALPVGVTGPAKRQKKTSCIYYRQDRSQSVHSPGGASYFISCLPLDVIASFSFGAKECAEEFLQRYAFEFLQRTLPSFLFFISTE